MSTPPSPDGAAVRPESVGSAPEEEGRRAPPAQVPVAAQQAEVFPAVQYSTTVPGVLGYPQVPPPPRTETPSEVWGEYVQVKIGPETTYEWVTLDRPGYNPTSVVYPDLSEDPAAEVISAPRTKGGQREARARRAAARQGVAPAARSPPARVSPVRSSRLPAASGLPARSAKALAASVSAALASCVPLRARSRSGGESSPPTTQLQRSGDTVPRGQQSTGSTMGAAQSVGSRRTPLVVLSSSEGGSGVPPVMSPTGGAGSTVGSGQQPIPPLQGPQGQVPPGQGAMAAAAVPEVAAAQVPPSSPAVSRDPPSSSSGQWEMRAAQPKGQESDVPPTTAAVQGPTMTPSTSTAPPASVPPPESIYTLQRPIQRDELEQALSVANFDFIVWQGTVRVLYSRSMLEPPTLALLAVPKHHVMPLYLPPSLRYPQVERIPVCPTVPWWDPRVTPGMIRKRLYQISKQELAWRKSTFDTRRNIWKVASRGVAKQQILNNLNQVYTQCRDRFASENAERIAVQQSLLTQAGHQLSRGWDEDQSGPESDEEDGLDVGPPGDSIPPQDRAGPSGTAPGAAVAGPSGSVPPSVPVAVAPRSAVPLLQRLAAVPQGSFTRLLGTGWDLPGN